jgi:hypothetical protein
MTHPTNEAMVHPDASRTPRDHVSKSAGSSDHAASSASRRSWFPPSIEDFEITPEAAMYAGRR